MVLSFPALVRLDGDRAVAETSIVILVRQGIEGLAVDMTARARFLDRLERRDGTWRILERAAIYEQDRLDPVDPDGLAGGPSAVEYGVAGAGDAEAERAWAWAAGSTGTMRTGRPVRVTRVGRGGIM